jgi:hypothetical protein
MTFCPLGSRFIPPQAQLTARKRIFSPKPLFPGKPSVSDDFLLKRPRNPRGESKNDPLRLDFDRQLTLEFHGSTVSSDAGLLSYRELDDAIALTCGG